MAKAQAKKKQDIINELCNHVDIIGDEKVKAFIKKRKTEKAEKLAKKQGIHRKADLDESMEEDEPIVAKKLVAKLKKAKKTK
jgi:hypothetical protein